MKVRQQIYVYTSGVYIELDVHKKTISYCVKDASSRVERQRATRAVNLWYGKLAKRRSMTS